MSRLDECLNISRQIIDKYIDLISNVIYLKNNDTDMSLVNEIRDLVLEEYSLIRKMNLEEIDVYLDRLSFSKDNMTSTSIVTRLYNKLIDYKQVLKGNGIGYNDIGVNIPYIDIKFSIYDGILTMFDIELIKRLKKKIDSLNVTCDSDRLFVDSLYDLLEKSKINFLFTASSAEVIALSSETDIDKLPDMDINKLKNSLKSSNFRDGTYKDFFENSIFLYTKKIIDCLASIYIVNNNPEDVFSYLVTVTQMEVLIDFMDKDMLNVVNSYCNIKITKENKISINMVKKLIKDKLDK